MALVDETSTGNMAWLNVIVNTSFAPYSLSESPDALNDVMVGAAFNTMVKLGLVTLRHARSELTQVAVNVNVPSLSISRLVKVARPADTVRT